ncbi:MAG: TetR/AcrR family transcriptional regulator [Saprospiraceae bacterium]
MNENLYIRDPEQTELGRKIILHSIQLIHNNGFESFNFKKLAKEISSTEAGIYRYFENKHKLLVYIIAWYWSWLEYRVTVLTLNIEDPWAKLKIIIKLLCTNVEDDIQTVYVNESILHQIIIAESTKAFMTNHVDADNSDKLFKPYKDLCKLIASIIADCNKNYKFPTTLASSIIEIAHLQNFFMNHLPSLTDFGHDKNEEHIQEFVEGVVMGALSKS